MAYTVLARKYRPQKLSDLVGQEVLVKVLSNSFKLKRIAHAYILTGSRGVGKTSTARIIAKGLNCEGPKSNNSPTIEPCGVCSSCVSITSIHFVYSMESLPTFLNPGKFLQSTSAETSSVVKMINIPII